MAEQTPLQQVENLRSQAEDLISNISRFRDAIHPNKAIKEELSQAVDNIDAAIGCFNRIELSDL